MPANLPVVAGRGTTATIALERAKIPFTVHEYPHDPRSGSYGLEASEALGVPPERVFKTLVAAVDGALAVGVVPVHRQLDLKALAAATGGKKAVMAEVAAAEPPPGTSRAASPWAREATARGDRRLGAWARHDVLQRRQARRLEIE